MTSQWSDSISKLYRRSLTTLSRENGSPKFWTTTWSSAKSISEFTLSPYYILYNNIDNSLILFYQKYVSCINIQRGRMKLGRMKIDKYRVTNHKLLENQNGEEENWNLYFRVISYKDLTTIRFSIHWNKYRYTLLTICIVNYSICNYVNIDFSTTVMKKLDIYYIKVTVIIWYNYSDFKKIW